MTPIGLETYLLVAVTLFCLGVFCVLTRRNSVGVLIGVELILNAANVNIVAFSRFAGNAIGGQLWAIIVIILAACEAVVFLAMLMSIYQSFDSIDVDRIATLKE